MPNRFRQKNKSKEDLLEKHVGSVTEELEAPVSSELVFRKIWRIPNFKKTILKRDLVDSPIFKCAVNGMCTFWSISIRFWQGPNHKKLTNPLVVCLNLTGCDTEETGQARVRFQLGIMDANIKHWECCPISSVIVNLENTNDLISIGYKSLNVDDRHLDSAKDVSIMVKIQIIQSNEEKHSLSQDMARVLSENEFVDTVVACSGTEQDDPILVHSIFIKIRSGRLARKLRPYTDERNQNIKHKIDLSEIGHPVVSELIRYIYTDKVDNAELHAFKLLPLATRYELPGLQSLCERALLESLTPNSVPGVLLLADECDCETLRKAALNYCESSKEIKDCVQTGKTLSWRVMEMVNPDLFMEACESLESSSSNLATHGSYSD